MLRTPKYHSELQQIEMCWGIVKNYKAKHCDFTFRKLRNNMALAFSQVTSDIYRKLMAKIVTEEDRYWD
jgi:hypothetical protein